MHSIDKRKYGEKKMTIIAGKREEGREFTDSMGGRVVEVVEQKGRSMIRVKECTAMTMSMS